MKRRCAQASRLQPVSYTHLDVYKRQGITFATGTPISNSMTELYVMQRYLQNRKLQNMGLGPVSYTHLDVYKRQEKYTVSHYCKID